MSAINGKGYGDSHDWENMGTDQHCEPQYRSTLFICKKCKDGFRHYYHKTPNIYDAIKNSNIKEECE